MARVGLAGTRSDLVGGVELSVDRVFWGRRDGRRSGGSCDEPYADRPGLGDERPDL